MTPLQSDNRGVSPVFSYVLTLSVASLLVGGLLISAGGFVDDQRKNTAKSELQVIGQQVSADISAADRLARTATTEDIDDIRVRRGLPQEVVGTPYRIEVVHSGGSSEPQLRLSSPQLDVVVTVGIASKIAVDGSADGGDVVVQIDTSTGDPEVKLQND